MAEHMLNLVLCVVLLTCFYTDLKEKRIYNKVIIAAIVAGLVLSFHAQGTAGLLNSGKGFLLGTALLLLPFAAGGMGAGDVKLLATIGLFKGTEFVFFVFLLAALLGGVYALVLLLWRGKLLSTLKDILLGFYLLSLSRFKINTLPSMQQKEAGAILFPYGPALVAASFMVYFYI